MRKASSSFLLPLPLLFSALRRPFPVLLRTARAPRRGLVLLQAKGLAALLKLKRLQGAANLIPPSLGRPSASDPRRIFECAFFFQRTAQDIKGVDEGQPRHGAQLHGLDERQVRFPPGTDDGGEDDPEQDVEKAGKPALRGQQEQRDGEGGPGDEPDPEGRGIDASWPRRSSPPAIRRRI